MKLHRLILVAGLVLSAGLASPALGDDFKREGEGARRSALDKMELKPFPAEAWAQLTDWTNGAAPTPGDLNGKVILICTWADWYAPCKRAMNQATKLAEKYGKDGLVVIAPHNATGWAEAKKPAAPKDSVFLLANDPKGEFRKAINADQDPNFYVIDRAGQMRFADLDKSAVEGAVESLLKEKAEDAASINTKLATDAAKKEAESRRTASINQGASLVDLPEISFPEPSADRYKNAAWPRMPKLENEPAPADPNSPPPPIQMLLPETGWIGPKPQLKGRARLVYFWHPDARLTTQIMPRMDTLKMQRSRDLVVVGAASKIADNTGENKLELDPKKLEARVREFTSARNLKHSIIVDPSGQLFDTSRRSQTGEFPIPWVAIVSSDGVMRWSGPMGAPSFEAALDKVLGVDPGIQARRAAEAEYLSKHGK